jgi:hypothetical protein
MNTYQTDENNYEVLLSAEEQQVMMEWEKPYMEASIDFLKPTGHVLEIGFGLGYSATRIMEHKPKSYTIIECDVNVINKIIKWSDNYTDIPINIVEGKWQEKLHGLGNFDQIYFDDFPLDIKKSSSTIEMLLSMKRLNLFLDLCIQSHTKVGSKISFYLNSNSYVNLSSDTQPFTKISYKSMDIEIPINCEYRNKEEQKCLIPLVEKTSEYDFNIVNDIARNEIRKMIEKER